MMDAFTKECIKRHLEHLRRIEFGVERDTLSHYDSLYDHLHVFLMSQGISEEHASLIVDDFRNA